MVSPAAHASLSGRAAYRIRSGDTLWAIAQAQLPNGASAQLIAEQVDTLWSLNATRIGTGDPDRILPGQQLHLR